MGIWHPHSGAAVYGDMWPATWEVADLSSIVGAKSTFVYIQVICSSSSDVRFSVRPNGDSDSYFDMTSPTGARGVCSCTASLWDSGVMLCLTDSEGKVQFKGEGRAYGVGYAYVLGWFDATSAEKLDVFDGVMPTSWTSQPLPSGPDENKDTLMFFKYKSTAGTDYIGLRPEGSSEEWWPDDVGRHIGGCAYGGDGIVNMAIGLLGIYEAGAGPFEHKADNAKGGPPTVDCDLLAYEQDIFTVCNELVYESSDSPVDWAELDLSSYVGGDALVLLKVKTAGSPPALEFGARKKGSLLDWITTNPGAAGGGCSCFEVLKDTYGIAMVPTDSDGKIEIYIFNGAVVSVSLIGILFGSDPTPSVSDVYPSGNVMSISDPNQISFTISNGFGIDDTTIDFKVRDPIGKETQIILGGVFQPGFSGFIVEAGETVGGHNTRIKVVVDSFDSLLLTKKWTFIVDAETGLGWTL
jgi:hypothetical protein